MNWIKTKWWLRLFFPNYTWKINTPHNSVYLTFDDGPIPEVSQWVLDLLKQEDIKATFFCIGENIQKHPEIFNRIVTENHAVGNHTFNHLNGWKTSTKDYLVNFELCERTIQKSKIKNQKIFRPPYGKISPSQSKAIRKKGYKIIMWDIISYDFDIKTSSEKCMQNVLENVESGSIIVFHDSLKAKTNLKYTLPKVIKNLKEKGFTFEVIS